MCLCGCGSAKSYRKPIANLRLRNTSCSFAVFAVAELSVNLRCPALLFSGSPIRRFGGPAFVLILVTLRFLPALLALIRP